MYVGTRHRYLGTCIYYRDSHAASASQHSQLPRSCVCTSRCRCNTVLVHRFWESLRLIRAWRSILSTSVQVVDPRKSLAGPVPSCVLRRSQGSCGSAPASPGIKPAWVAILSRKPSKARRADSEPMPRLCKRPRYLRRMDAAIAMAACAPNFPQHKFLKGDI